MTTVLLTIDALRYDHRNALPETRDRLDWHYHAYTTAHATAAVFPTLFTGHFVDIGGLDDHTLLPEYFEGYSAGITENNLVSGRYGYDRGFDAFQGRQAGMLDRLKARIDSEGPYFNFASKAWNAYLKVARLSDRSRTFRSAADILEDVPVKAIDDPKGFVWAHLMDPHAPHDEPLDGMSRARSHELFWRAKNGSASADEQDLVRRLYRKQVASMDDAIAAFLDRLGEDDTVIVTADHGELLGEGGQWGHCPVAREEVLRVPFGYRNIEWDFGDIVSLVDVASMLTGQIVGRGRPGRNLAYAHLEGETVAIDSRGILPAADVVSAGSKFDADGADLRALGYIGGGK